MVPALPPPPPPSSKPNNASYSMELVLHNSDLVREILEWLPAKSLVKFQSVSREWHSLISSTEFRQQHTIRCLKVQQSLILQTGRKYFHLNPTSRQMTSFSPSLPNDVQYFILQSSNGLLLLRRCFYFVDDYYLYVHNPATKKSRRIMNPPPSTTHPHDVDVTLAFDPSKSPYYHLLWIRGSSHRAEAEAEAVTYRIEVYTSKSHTWNRKLSFEPFTLPTNMGMCFCFFKPDRVRVYWNNAIYWSSEEKPYYCCFDVAKGKMRTLPCPPYKNLNVFDHRLIRRKNGYWRLQESNGHLYHVELMGSEGGYELVAVWELSEDHQWLLRHHLALPPTPQWEWRKWEAPSILTFFVETCTLLICRQDRSMRVYSLKFGSCEDFFDAICGEDFDYLRAFQFGETFALV